MINHKQHAKCKSRRLERWLKAQDRGEQLAAEEKSVKYQTFLNQLNLKFSKKIIWERIEKGVW